MRSRRVLLAAFTVTMLLACQVLMVGAGKSEVPRPGPAYDVVAVFPVGSGPLDASVVDLVGNGIVGPQAFWVEEDGSAMLLDTMKDRILVHGSDGVRREMALEAHWPQDLAVRGCDVFVLDGWQPKVLRLDRSGGRPEWLALPAEALDQGLPRLAVTPDRRVVLDSCGAHEVDVESRAGAPGLSRHDTKRSTMTVGGGKATLSFGSVATEFAFPGRYGSARQIGTDVRGNTYVEVAGVRGQVVGNLSVDLRIYRVDRDGNKTGSFPVSLDEYVTFPNRFAQVTPEGDVYYMVVGPERIEVRKVLFDGIVPQDDMADVSYATAPPGSETVPQDVQVESVPGYLTSGATVDRDTAQAYAECTITQGWWYNYANGQHGPGTEKPDYLVSIPYGTYMGDDLAGIPYCWGGYDGYNKSSNPSQWSYFVDAMSQGVLAGNTLCEGTSWVPGTAGVDCTGFVAANVGWSGTSKPSGPSMRSQSYLVPADLLETMDVLYKPEEHMLHFIGLTADGNVATKESTTWSTSTYPGEKTKNFARTWAYLAVSGYEPRTFWATSAYGTTFSNAAMLPVQQDIGGYVTYGQNMYYKFWVQSGRTYTVTLDPSPEPPPYKVPYRNPDLYVYSNASTSYLIGSSTLSGWDATDAVTFTAQYSRYYYIRVRGACTATNWGSPYQLSYFCSLQGSTLDNPIEYTGPCSDMLTLGQDRCYWFTANAGNDVTVTLSTTSGRQGLYVYDTNRVSLGSVADGGSAPAQNSVIFMANDTAEPAPPYVYVLKVHALASGGHSLSIGSTPGSPDSILYQPQSGTLVGNQIVSYRFFAAVGVRFTIEMSGSNNYHRLLLDPLGNPLIESWGTPNSMTYTAPMSGVYWVYIIGEVGVSGDYHTAISFTQQ